MENSLELQPAARSDALARSATESRAFGRSLHADFYGVRRELCDDLGFCYALLDQLVEHLEMHKQSPPYIFRSPEDQFPDKAGLSGWVPLIESGISLHTLTVKEFMTFDIYTCGELDASKCLEFLCARLAPSKYEHHYLVRGLAYHA